jgi:hypothetical protein
MVAMKLTATYRQWMTLGLGHEAWRQWIVAQSQLKFQGSHVVPPPPPAYWGVEGSGWSVAYHVAPKMEIFVARDLPEKRAHDLADFLNGKANFVLVKPREDA